MNNATIGMNVQCETFAKYFSFVSSSPSSGKTKIIQLFSNAVLDIEQLYQIESSHSRLVNYINIDVVESRASGEDATLGNFVLFLF